MDDPVTLDRVMSSRLESRARNLGCGREKRKGCEAADWGRRLGKSGQRSMVNIISQGIIIIFYIQSREEGAGSMIGNGGLRREHYNCRSGIN